MINLSGKKILVVDDEPDLLQILIDQFEMLGATVFSAENGNRASRILATQQMDLIISDVRMADGDGLTLLKNVRAQNQTSPPFIFITGFSDFTRDQAKAYGAFEMLSKPFRMQDLESVVQRALNLP